MVVRQSWLALVLCCCLLAVEARAANLFTHVEPGVLLLRGVTFYKIAPGVVLQDGDIVTAPAKAQVQIELDAGTLASFAGPGSLWIEGLASGAPTLTVPGGALKVAAKAPGVRLRTAAFDVALTDAIVVLRVELAATEIFVEAGSARLVNPTSPPRDAKRGEFVQKSLSTAFASRPLPPRAFVDALPRAFLDALPALAPGLKSKAVPVADHDITYAEAQPWLALDRPVFERRFTARLRDPAFRKAAEAEIARYPAWDRLLHPDKYERKPAPK